MKITIESELKKISLEIPEKEVDIVCVDLVGYIQDLLVGFGYCQETVDEAFKQAIHRG